MPELTSWAAEFGLGLTLFSGWSVFIEQVLFWSELPKLVGAAEAVRFIHARLLAVEVSPNAVELWQMLRLNGKEISSAIRRLREHGSTKERDVGFGDPCVTELREPLDPRNPFSARAACFGGLSLPPEQRDSFKLIDLHFPGLFFVAESSRRSPGAHSSATQIFSMVLSRVL